MPIFEFVCTGCGEKFETLVLGSRTPSCPKCNGTDLEKQMSAFAFRSSGAGGESSAGGGCSGCAGGNCASCH
ncbi:MAG: zinc ribbon domain-containing protein [Deltaproteobacteria bacterium]|nr:zinc ribbon domain-containing protein [Deltaproteobacteria bacterium]